MRRILFAVFLALTTFAASMNASVAVTVAPLATGVGGATGCDYQRALNRLVFVESTTGKLSAVDMVRTSGGITSWGTDVLKGTWFYDLDGGTEGTTNAPPDDIWWEQIDAVRRRMVPAGGARIANIGVRSLAQFNAITVGNLQTQVYGTTPVNGNNDATNQLVNNDVFAVLTNQGNYAKVQVVTYGYNLTFRWVTYIPSVVSFGAATLPGTYTIDLDNGIEGLPSDIWWRQIDTVRRQMTPVSGASIANIGVMSAAQFNALTPTQLQAAPYNTTPINGNNDATNQLVPNDVFAVRTNQGNYAKVQVLVYGYNLNIQWVTYRLNPAYHVLGSGYQNPEDVKISGDGRYAYITERSGNFLKTDLTLAPHADRATAHLVTSKLAAPMQISLDEAHGNAYLVENANPGRIDRINLATGTRAVVFGNLEFPIGLLMTSDLQTAYVTENVAGANRLSRIDLGASLRTTLATNGSAPFFFLTWADPLQTSIFTTLRDPVNQVVKLDLTASPPALRSLATVYFRPSSVAVLSATQLFLCTDSTVSLLNLGGAAFSSSAPIFMGIGFVPVDRIVNGATPFNGHADTSADPSYFFQVKGSPFGGTLPIMVNYATARSLGATYYKVEVDGVAQTSSWSDYVWDPTTTQFVLQTIVPLPGGYYPVRRATDTWYNPWLGLRLDSTSFADGLHTIVIRLFNGGEVAYPAGVIRSRQVWFDNVWPNARIEHIQHVLPTGMTEEVGACGIVTTRTNYYTFVITADDGVAGHLRSWNLDAYYGDNLTSHIDGATYVPTTTPIIPGFDSMVVPEAPWSSPANCAYTFILGVWDSAIDGDQYIHYSQYHKSATLETFVLP